MAAADEVILRLSRSRRWLAPLALAVGAFVMLFAGVKLLFTNWRLTLIQVLPAMWIWAAMFDLKAHALHGKSFHVLTGPIVIPLVLGVALITAASFFLNAWFAYAIVGTGPPSIRPAFTQAWSHRRMALLSGFIVGILLGLCTVVVTRWGRPWFGLSLSIVVGLMMICYVAVPARLIGMKTRYSKRDKLAATRGGRDSRSGGLHAALSPRPPRAAHARVVEHILRPRHHRPGHRADVAGGRDRRGEDGQDDRQAGPHPRPQPPASRPGRSRPMIIRPAP